MLIVDINEKEIVTYTIHGDERRQYRDDVPVNIDKEEIETIVKKSFHRLKSYWGKFETFVIKNTKTGLNVVGRLLKRGPDWIFKVITVMVKDRFRPYHDDKVIVAESIHFPTFAEWIQSLE